MTANVTIKITPGDITRNKADALVSSIHRSRDLTKGPLASQVKPRGGQSVQDALNRVHGKRDLNHGEVVVTTPEQLAGKFKLLMFVCLYCWRPGNDQALTAAVKECLNRITEIGLRSIAIPALGMGGQSYPPFLVAKSIVTAIIQFIQSNPDTPLTTVYIVLKDRDMNSTRTFLQTAISVLAGVELGRDFDSSSNSVNLQGVSNFHGLENTRPRSLAQEVNTQATQNGTHNQINPSNANIPSLVAAEIIRPANNVRVSVQPEFSLTNWTAGINCRVVLDLTSFVPSFMRWIINYLWS